MLDRFTQNLSGSERIALVFVLTSFALALTIVRIESSVTKIALGLICAGMVVGAFRLATPAEARVVWLRYASLSTAAAVATSVVFFNEFLDSVLAGFIRQFLPSFELIQSNSNWLSALVLLFTLLVVWIVNRGNSIQIATNRTRLGVLDHPDNRADRDQLIEDLSAHLETLDKELQWSSNHFIELAADIDLVLGNERRRSAGNLLQAIQKNSAKLFVVLGDPGSGKSVALRTLTRYLLAQTCNGGQIPIYVNLREWQGSSAEILDSVNEIASPITQFILSLLRSQLSDVSYKFLSKHFDRLQSEGQFFFILDSFDEIPAVLDVSESSSLIENLSERLYRFVLSGRGARGLVASRYYRRPTIRRRDRCVLEIRPFNETRIGQHIDQQAVNPDVLKRRVFIESALLGSAARSPFLLSLIIDYEKHHPPPVPESQTELFEAYIEQAISNAISLQDDGIRSLPDMMTLCEDIANLMFERENLGLEVPIQTVVKEIKGLHVKSALECLRDQRLFRISESGQLSFAHRRFQEYFIVRRLLDFPQSAPLDAIIEDSRWRDSMALYAEIAPDRFGIGKLKSSQSGTTPIGEAERIADFCWQHIRVLTINNPQSDPARYLQGLNALRFLVESFRGRPHVTESFREPFGEQVKSVLSDGTVDLLNARYAVEAVAFLPSNDAAKTLEAALRIESPWIAETAFRACRYLGQVPDTIIDALQQFVNGLTLREVRERSDELNVALNFNEQFESVQKTLSELVFFRKICSFGFWGLLFVAPLVWFSIIILSIVKLLDSLTITNNKEIRNELLRRLRRSDSIDFFSHGCKKLAWWYMPIAIMFSWASMGYAFLELDQWRPEAQTLFLPLTFCVTALTTVWCLILLVVRMKKLSLTSSFRKYLAEFEWVAFIIWLPLFGVGWATNSFAPWITTGLVYLFMLAVSLGFLFMFVSLLIRVKEIFFELYRLIADKISDRQRLRQATRVFTPDRSVVGEHFLSFASDTYREQYVSWLEEQALDQRCMKRLSESNNIWPLGSRPNVANDEASARLAQLDARWIGIERS